METFEVLQKWGKYSDFDPDRKRFNLLTGEYSLHRCNTYIQQLSEYDPTGVLAVIYAKNICRQFLQESKVTLFEVISSQNAFSESIEMWKIFCSEDVQEIENSFLDGINLLVAQVVKGKTIGERDVAAERDALFSSVSAVVEELGGCNVELFCRGHGPILPVQHFSTYIHVFERLAECLLALEAAPKDGIYLCYINNNGTSDGYFGLFIKSNGNILSVNERVNEAYPGQHKTRRGGRWSETKKFNVFPYHYIFSFSDYDGKGYASKHIIDTEKLAFFYLTPDAYMPLILAMVMVNTKYSNADVSDMPLMLVDFLLPANLELPTPGTQALDIPSNSGLIAVSKGFQLQMTADDVMRGAYSECFDWETAKNRREAGYFPKDTDAELFIRLYGDGFALDVDRLLEANTQLKGLTSAEIAAFGETPNPEFIGTENRMTMIAYSNARKQLAEYIRDKMLEEYLTFGGRGAVDKWWTGLLLDRKELLFDLCAQKYLNVHPDEKQAVKGGLVDGGVDPLQFILLEENCKGYPETSHGRALFNVRQKDKYGRANGKYCCPFTGVVASIFFLFHFRTWRELADIFGEEELPKIVKGWKHEGHHIAGNHILNVTDAVTGVGTPFEDHEARWNRRLWTAENWKRYYWDNRIFDETLHKIPTNVLQQRTFYSFNLLVGFSKRGFARFLKERKNKA